MDRHRYVTSVSPNGRYFADQHGDPLLLFGDSAWAGPSRWSAAQAELYFQNREELGINAAIMSLVGARSNGGPADDGSTYDGLRPFTGDDPGNWDERYWARIDDIVRSACAHGITLFLYPIDGWNVQHVFRTWTPAQGRRYGAQVAERYARFPNIVWVTGGDYFPGDAELGANLPKDSDEIFEAVLDGIRSTADTRPFSIQLGYPESLSTDNPRWAPLVDWNFAYTYYPTYRAVLDGYQRSGGRDPRPTLLGESNYEGENNISDSPPTTNESLRRQMLWSLTSGSPGYFYGSADWSFPPNWEQRLSTPAVSQLGQLAALFGSLPWQALTPDQSSATVLAGRGTEVARNSGLDVLDNDFATVATAADGTLSLVYVPTRRTLRLDTSRLSPPWTATWIDPSRATGAALPASVDPSGLVTSPGPNADGGDDWLLVLRGQPPRGGTTPNDH